MSNIKANELMVNDWYYDKNLNKPRQWHQLQFFEAYGNPTYMMLCQPISLTEDILKTNCWNIDTEEFNECQFVYATNNNINEYIIASNDQYRWHLLVGRYDDTLCTIYYVHELQHALRLCGLNELADNFKIVL